MARRSCSKTVYQGQQPLTVILTTMKYDPRRGHWSEIVAGVAESADALDSKSSGLNARVGSSPTSGTVFHVVCVLRGLRHFFGSPAGPQF